MSASSFLTLPTIPPVIFLNAGIPALAISVGHFLNRSPGILVTFQVICSTDNFKRVKKENVAYPWATWELLSEMLPGPFDLLFLFLFRNLFWIISVWDRFFDIHAKKKTFLLSEPFNVRVERRGESSYSASCYSGWFWLPVLFVHSRVVLQSFLFSLVV